MRQTGTDRPHVPPRDNDYPRDDPYDADAVRFILHSKGAGSWTRSTLLPHMRAQASCNQSRVREAQRVAGGCGVDIRAHVDGKTLHFFRTDIGAPLPYPSSETERRDWIGR